MALLKSKRLVLVIVVAVPPGQMFFLSSN